MGAIFTKTSMSTSLGSQVSLAKDPPRRTPATSACGLAASFTFERTFSATLTVSLLDAGLGTTTALAWARTFSVAAVTGEDTPSRLYKSDRSE